MAEDTSGIVKIGVFLGFVFLIVSLFYPTQSGWTQFQNTVQGFPTFENPFDNDTYEIEMLITGDGSIAPWASTDNGTTANCDTSANPGGGTDWWGCVTTQDDETSYASTNATETEFRVVLGPLVGVSNNLPVLAIRILTQCRGTSANQDTDYIFYKSDDTTLVAEIPSGFFICPQGPTFTNVTTLSHFDTPHIWAGNFSGGRLLFNPVEPTTGLDFSFIRITFIIASESECFGADTLTYIGCIISGFFNFLIKTGRFIVNSIIFVGQIIAYFLVVIAAFFTMFTFFFSLPGAPSIIQTIISVIIIGCLLYILISILKIVRGSGATG